MSRFAPWLTALSADGLGGVLIILLPLGVIVFLCACAAFVWAVRGRQFDNLDVEAQRILFEPDAGCSGTRASAAEGRAGEAQAVVVPSKDADATSSMRLRRERP